MFYAIKHKRTGFLMPLNQGTRMGRGFTHVEPTQWGTPRLFTRRQDAKCALTWWVKGEVHHHVMGDDEWCDIKPVANRDAADFGVVGIELTVKELQP